MLGLSAANDLSQANTATNIVMRATLFVRTPPFALRRVNKRLIDSSAKPAALRQQVVAGAVTRPQQHAETKQEFSAKIDHARPWKAVAGPPLSPSAFHCATVSDGGDYERIEAESRAALRAAGIPDLPILGGCFTDPVWREVISPDGVRCFIADKKETT